MVGQMSWLGKRLGPWPVRVWGLILNFIGNALAVYGAVEFIQDGSSLPILIIGVCLTLLCLLVLSVPNR
jgi:hypothetical protein